MLRILKGVIVIFLVSSLMVSFSGCFDDVYEDDLISQECISPCVTLMGVLTTGDGNEPLANTQVEAIWNDNISAFRSKLRKKAQTITDENGFYEMTFFIRFEERSDGYFFCQAIVDTSEYWQRNDHDKFPRFGHHNLKNDTTYVSDFFIPYNASIYLHFSNINSLESADRVDIELDSYTIEEEKFSSYVTGLITDQNLDTRQILIDIPALIPLVLEIRVTRDGIKNARQYEMIPIKDEEIRFTSTF
jgi:hypothetical protein